LHERATEPGIVINNITIHPFTANVSFKMDTIAIPVTRQTKINLSFQSMQSSSYREIRCMTQPFIFKRMISEVVFHKILACVTPLRVELAADLLLNKQYFEIPPLRPTRLLHPDGFVRAFVHYQAKGASLLKVHIFYFLALYNNGHS